MRSDWLPLYFRAEFPRECAFHEPSSPPDAVRRSLNEFASLLTLPGRDQPRRMLLPRLRCAGTFHAVEKENNVEFGRFARHFTSTDGSRGRLGAHLAEWAGRQVWNGSRSEPEPQAELAGSGPQEGSPGLGSSSGAGVPDVPTKPGVAFAGTVTPVAGMAISAPATASFVIVLRRRETIAQFIYRSLGADPNSRCDD